MAFAHSAIISRAHSLSLSLSLSLSRARARALSLEREARGAAARNSGRRHAFAQRRSARRARCAARRRTATTTTAAPTRGRTGDATRRPPPGIPKRCTVRLLDASGAERGATPRSAADSTRYAARRGVGAPRAGRGAALADTWCCVLLMTLYFEDRKIVIQCSKGALRLRQATSEVQFDSEHRFSCIGGEATQHSAS